MSTLPERVASSSSISMPSGTMTPASCASAPSASSSFCCWPSSAPFGYLPTAVGLPNLSAKVSQKVIVLRLKKTGQNSMPPMPAP